MFTLKELRLLRSNIVDEIVSPSIDPHIRNALEAMPSFDMNHFELILYEQTKLAIEEKNREIIEMKERFTHEIEKKCMKSKNITLVDMLKKSIEYYYTYSNMCHYPNPLIRGIEFYNVHRDRSDISNDSSSRYDGEEGRMDCWELESNSRSTDNVFCLQDAFDIGWYVDNEMYNKLFKIAKVYYQFGFRVLIVAISSWRKGYDYTIYDLSKCTEEDYIELQYKPEYVRFYISDL